MSASYPVMLDIAHIRTLVVGGGAVATRKARALAQAGGLPVILSPGVTDELQALIRQHDLVWIQRRYLRGDTRRYRMVITATDDPDVNRVAADDARADGALVLRADEGGASDFHVPSHVRQDDVVVAVSTGGASPLLARRIRERLEQTVATPGLGRAARRLAELRADVQARWADDEDRRRAFWFDLITPEFLDLAVAGRDEDVEQAIDRCLLQS